MRRSKFIGVPIMAALSFSGVGVTWQRYDSTLYPYRIAQPSSYRHIVIEETSGTPADYFFPSLGSNLTNLHVDAVRGRVPTNLYVSFRGMGGGHVRQSGWMHLAGQNEPLICADFKVLVGSFTIERVTFASRGMVWTITVSYDQRYRRERPNLIKMMQSFKLR